jgi:hypothetical protein
VSKTISGAIHDEFALVGPAGLYYAPGSIVLRHPDAFLVFQAGVRIMFAEGATIRIDQGTFQVLGTEESPVELISATFDLVSEFGDTGIDTSSTWGGVWMGSGSTGSEFLSQKYTGGSVFRHCSIENAGYVFPASIHIEQTSIYVDNVSITKSGGNGIAISGAFASALLENSVVADSQKYGIHLDQTQGTVVINKVDVTGSFDAGVYANMYDGVTIIDSNFWNNYLRSPSSTSSRQIYCVNGRGRFEMTGR